MANTATTNANLVIIRGLDRGTHPAGLPVPSPTGEQVADGPTQLRGFRVKHPTYRQFTFESQAVAASYAWPGSSLTFTANYKGAYGNNIHVAVTTGAGQTVATTWGASSADPIFTVTVPSGTTASGVANLLNTDETASQFITCSYGIAGQGVGTFTSQALAGGSNGVGADAEPSTEVEGVAGAPIWLRVTNKSALVVDTTDLVTARTLKRNQWRYVVVGFPT